MKDVTDVFGKYGPWQRLIFILTLLRGVPTAFHNLSIPFFAPNMDYWCARPPSLQNWTVDQWRNLSIPQIYKDGKLHYSKCSMYTVTISDDQVEVDTNRTISCSDWEFDHSEYKSTITEDFNLVCERDWLISLTQSLYMGGMMAGVLLFGHLADRFGRRPILHFCVSLMMVAGIAAAFSPNFIFFNVARFCLALGVAGTQNTSFCLLMEILGPEYRTRVTFAFSFGWVAGLLILPGLAYVIRDWMYLEITSTLAGVVLLTYWCFMPESPRWLLTRGKYEYAEKVIRKACKKNKLEVSNMDATMKELRENIEKEARKQNPNIFDLFRTSKLRKNTLNVYFCYFSVAFVFYGLSLAQTNLGGNPFLNFFIGSAVEIPAYILCIISVKYFRRRPSLLFFYFIGGVACFFMIASSDELFWMKLTAAMIGKLCISGAFIILAIHAAEIFPTVVRTVGAGSGLMMGRVGAMTAPFVKELGHATHEAVTPIVFGVLSIAAGFLILLLPETKNSNLPDTIQDAECLNMVSKRNKSDIPMKEEANGIKPEDFINNKDALTIRL